MLGRGRGVPVRAVPLINGCSACRALLGVRHVARRARDVVVRDNGWTHRLKRPIGGVAPARGSGGQELKGGGGGGGERGASTEKCGGGGEEEESKKQTSANLKKWGMTGGEHRGLAEVNPQASSGGVRAESSRCCRLKITILRDGNRMSALVR